MKKPEDEATRERILNATVKLLLSAESEKITIRRIAQDSKVNVAAINYHFRSKDELLDQAIAKATGLSFAEGLKILFARGKPVEQRLEGFIKGYAQGLMEFQGLTRIAVQNLIKENKAGQYNKFIKEMIEKMATALNEITGDKDNQLDKLRSLMLLSCALFPFIVSNNLEESGIIDYGNSEEREHYLDFVLNQITKK